MIRCGLLLLLALPGLAGAGAWSPDGRTIAFSYIGGPENIYLVDATGGEARPLVVRARREFRPEWSPDGAHLIFTAVVNDAPVIMRVNADGTDLHALTTPGESAGDPHYSPDGHRIAYHRDVPGARDLFVRDMRTGEVTQLTTLPGISETSPRWGPHGKRIVFVSKVNDDAPGDIVLLDMTSLRRTHVTRSPNVSEFHPVFSRDGSRVAYVRVEDGEFSLAVCDLKTREERIVARGNGYAVLDPHFTPADDAITFTRTDFAEEGPGMPALVTVSLVDGEETVVTRGRYLSQMASDEAASP